MDPRFYENKGPKTALVLAGVAGCTIARGDPTRLISGISSAERAEADSVTFLEKNRDGALDRLTAGLCFLPEALAADAPADVTVAATPRPRRAFAAAALALWSPREIGAQSEAIASTARLETGVLIGPGCVIGEGATIGSGSRLGPNTVIGPGVQIGRNVEIGACASIRCALIGDNVTLLSGARIGETGFGLAAGSTMAELVPHFGRVIIQNGASIGANSCVDRGLFEDTVVGEGTHIDNLCQIAHNVKVGAHVAMASFAGVSGSVIIGDGVVFGGRVGVADHQSIGAGARVAGGSAVVSHIAPGQSYGGYPAKPLRAWARDIAWLDRESQRRKPHAKD